MNHLHEAFHEILDDVKVPGIWYVVLMEKVRSFGGPEEGGWWVTDNIVVAYREFPSKKIAEEAKKKVEELAKEMTKEERNSHGKHCLNQMEWLDARGLDSDYLPENSGPNEYYVIVTEEIPQDQYASRVYE
jgi:hypothetical protein